MTYLKGAYSYEPHHRLYEPFRQLLTLTASLMVGITAAMSDGDIHEQIDAIVYSRQFKLFVFVPMRGVLQFAAKNRKPDKIEIRFSRPLASPLHPKEVGDFPKMLVLAASTSFASFYEAHQDWLKRKHQQKWPPVINFARAVRNAISHSGKIHFEQQQPRNGRPRNPPMPVSWHHLSYSIADNGEMIIGTEIDYAELLILMIELSDERDRLEAPIPT